MYETTKTILMYNANNPCFLICLVITWLLIEKRRAFTPSNKAIPFLFFRKNFGGDFCNFLRRCYCLRPFGDAWRKKGSNLLLISGFLHRRSMRLYTISPNTMRYVTITPVLLHTRIERVSSSVECRDSNPNNLP